MLTRYIQEEEEIISRCNILNQDGYDDYYELCLKLIRKGGIIAFDNTLLGGAVVK